VLIKPCEPERLVDEARQLIDERTPTTVRASARSEAKRARS